jgi:NADP-dependent 3-hydroxy acid dehydrogenase YdfG
MSGIEGKVVLVTGASSGIGEATARLLASRGARVFAGARRTDRLEALVADLERAGAQAGALALDVTKRAEVALFVQAALAKFGRIDVLVNNAGLMALAPLAKTLVDEWERMVDVNVKGVLYGIAAALPIFQAQKSGHFITIASVNGFKVNPGAAVYAGTKHAVRAICEGLRQEVGGTIRTTLISPGTVQSELPLGSSDAYTAARIQEIYRRQAIPADSVARAVAYAVAEPADVDVNEIVVRPTVQDF